MAGVRACSAIVAADWIDACRRAARAVERDLARCASGVQRGGETGERGEGGDRTLIIDQIAEDAIFEQLARLRRRGLRFRAISEERGEVDFGDATIRVIIDPIDGSLNAKRGLAQYAVSIAVADGPTMADVALGFVHDFGSGEEWVACRGEGAWCNGVALDRDLPERRARDGRLEMLGIESADPRWLARCVDELVEQTHRLRAIGSIAISLCQVAGARLDAMASLRSCRSVDAAAGQLIVREAGGWVSFPCWADPLGAPLDLQARSPVVAARSPATLESLGGLVMGALDPSS